MAMDCFLCSSPELESAAGEGDGGDSSDNDTDDDHGQDPTSTSSSKFVECLCQLLGLPLTNFGQDFQSTDIGFCLSCSQILSSVKSLFDVLQQLQEQIGVARDEVSQRLSKTVNMDKDSRRSSRKRNRKSNSSTQRLRQQVINVLQSGKNGHAVEENTGVVLSSGFTAGDEFKEEFLNDNDDDEGTELLENHSESEEIFCPDSPSPSATSLDQNVCKKSRVMYTRKAKQNNRLCRAPAKFKETENSGQKFNRGKQSRSTSKILPRETGTGSGRKRSRKVQDIGPGAESIVEVITSDLSGAADPGDPTSVPTLFVKIQKLGPGREKHKTIPCTFPDCPIKFKTIWAQQVHVHKIHSVPWTLQCPDCPKTFRYKCQLEVHQRLHTGELPFVCEECGRGFRSALFLRDHKKVVHAAPSTRPHRCPHCPKTFVDRTTLNIHVRRHRKIREVICEICSQAFYTMNDLYNHKAKFHPPENDDDENADGAKTNPNPNKCGICGKIFSSPSYKRSHEKTHSGNAGPFQCHVCTYSCDRKSRLDIHLKSHSEERQFSCDLCEKKFKHKAQVHIHRRDHTGERPYKCPECPKEFKDLTHLSRHRALHSGLKPFKCDLCEEGFPLKKYLNRHLARHEAGKI